MTALHRYASLAFPDHLRRTSALDPKYHTDGYLDAFDAETFWYDAIWADGVIALYCPPLNNLRRAVRKARFRADGVPITLRRIRRFKRHEIVELVAAKPPTTLSVYLDDWRGESAVNRADPALLAGKSVCFYANRNNDLGWMRDHAQFHRFHHGLDAVVVFENGSDLYGPEAVAEALHAGGVMPLILPAPFKFGPLGKAPYRRMEKYMQSALYNALRPRFLDAVAGVMTIDVDEMILPAAHTVFEACAASRLGFVQIAGDWRDPAPGAEGPFNHADHSHGPRPPEACPPKWCARPGSPLWGWQWDNHGIERLPFLHSRTHAGIQFAHCRGVTTGWKKQNRLKARDDTQRRDDLVTACAEAGLYPQ